MDDKQKVFSQFMDEFVKLNINQKNTEIIEKQKLILAHLIKYAAQKGIVFEFLKSREINDISDYNGSNEDYLEAIMVYTHNIEELIGIIFNNI